MVSPAVIAGFAAIDATLIGQVAYAVRDLQRHDEANRQRDREAGSPPRSHRRSQV